MLLPTFPKVSMSGSSATSHQIMCLFDLSVFQGTVIRGLVAFRDIRVRFVRVRWVRVGGLSGSVQAGTQSVRDWLLVAIVGFFNGKMHI